MFVCPWGCKWVKQSLRSVLLQDGLIGLSSGREGSMFNWSNEEYVRRIRGCLSPAPRKAGLSSTATAWMQLSGGGVNPRAPSPGATSWWGQDRSISILVTCRHTSDILQIASSASVQLSPKVCRTNRRFVLKAAICMSHAGSRCSESSFVINLNWSLLTWCLFLFSSSQDIWHFPQHHG